MNPIKSFKEWRSSRDPWEKLAREYKQASEDFLEVDENNNVRVIEHPIMWGDGDQPTGSASSALLPSDSPFNSAEEKAKILAALEERQSRSTDGWGL